MTKRIIVRKRIRCDLLVEDEATAVAGAMKGADRKSPRRRLTERALRTACISQGKLQLRRTRERVGSCAAAESATSRTCHRKPGDSTRLSTDAPLQYRQHALSLASSSLASHRTTVVLWMSKNVPHVDQPRAHFRLPRYGSPLLDSRAVSCATCDPRPDDMYRQNRRSARRIFRRGCDAIAQRTAAVFHAKRWASRESMCPAPHDRTLRRVACLLR